MSDVQVGQKVWFEVSEEDGGRRFTNGTIVALVGSTLTVEYPGILDMARFDALTSELKLKDGAWRLKRVVPET